MPPKPYLRLKFCQYELLKVYLYVYSPVLANAHALEFVVATVGTTHADGRGDAAVCKADNEVVSRCKTVELVDVGASGEALLVSESEAM